MQLSNRKARRLLTLTISGGLLASSFSFSYGSLDRSSEDELSNSYVGKFIQKINADNYSNMSLKFIFDQKLLAWKRKTRFYSFADQIVKDKNFVDIVAMGKDVVPFILEEINTQPSPLVWSLNFIYNKRISENPQTTIEQACKLWIKELS